MIDEKSMWRFAGVAPMAGPAEARHTHLQRNRAASPGQRIKWKRIRTHPDASRLVMNVPSTRGLLMVQPKILSLLLTEIAPAPFEFEQVTGGF